MQLLRELLERIDRGETAFSPKSQSQEDIASFQKVANRLVDAKERGLIHDLRPLKGSSGGRTGFVHVMVLGGLTLQGEQFLGQASTALPLPSPATTIQGNHVDIFISHSTEDNEVAKKLITLLRASMPVSPDRIRCTSVDGYKLPAGSSFNDQLRAEVFDSSVLVALLSPASLNSMYTLFELGARWGAQKYLAPILISGTPISLLKQPLASLNAILSSSESSVSQLLGDVAGRLGVQLHAPHTYFTELRTFCEQS